MIKFLLIICCLAISTKVFYNVVDLTLSSKSDFQVKGIDISHHNEIYNWNDIKNNSKFCIMKATEGSSFKDPMFIINWTNTKKNNIVRGAYHFFSPEISAKKQFDNFKSRVKLSSGDLPPILDVELKSSNMKQVNEWLKLAENHYGVKPIVYSDYYFFKVLMDGKLDNRYPIWLHFNHNYGLKPSFNNYNCIMWQYNQFGRIKGINGKVDLNTFLGDSNIFSNILIK